MERNQRNIHVRRKVLDAVLYTDQGLIGIEMNASYKRYLLIRNTAFAFHLYSHYTYRGKEQYGLGKTGMLLVNNFRIIEWNMEQGVKKFVQ